MISGGNCGPEEPVRKGRALWGCTIVLLNDNSIISAFPTRNNAADRLQAVGDGETTSPEMQAVAFVQSKRHVSDGHALPLNLAMAPEKVIGVA